MHAAEIHAMGRNNIGVFVSTLSPYIKNNKSNVKKTLSNALLLARNLHNIKYIKLSNV